MKIVFDKLRLEFQMLVVFLCAALLAVAYEAVKGFAFERWMTRPASEVASILAFSVVASVAFLFFRNWAVRLSRALRENESHLRFLVASSPVAIYTCAATPPYAATYISPNVARLMGYTPEQFTESGDFWADNIHPEDRERVLGSLLKVFEHDEHRYEYRFRWPDGSYHWMVDDFRLIRDETGEPVEIIGYWADITERRWLDDQLRLQALVLDQIQDHVTITDLDGFVTYVNQSEASVNKLLANRVGAHVSAYGDAPQADATHQEIVEATREKGAWHGKVVNFMADGSPILLDLRTTLIKDENGTPVAMVGIGTDITERKRAEAELIAAKEEAQEAYQAKSAFLARMSHELRTPLNAILGFAQVMESDVDEATIGEYRDSITTIIRSGWHLLRIINDLLNLSAIEANKVDLQYESFDIGIAIHASFSLVSPLANERGITLSCLDDGCDGLMVLADPFRFDQVLINLLANAIKYNRDEGSVTVSCQHTPGRIRVLISDTGGGIPGSELPSLFQPFSRLSQRPYQIEGAGIGLSIAKQLTELMGGMIGVESVVGKGSTFWIEFPEGEVLEAISASVSTLPPLDDVTNCIQATLLYIEDNPDHTNLVMKIVSQMNNLSLLTAHTPGLGLDLARAHGPDLILLDICLPGMNGYEVLDLLQADERTCNIPVIAISATANPAEIEKGLKAGFRHYLTKPLNLIEFRKIVSELLGASS